MGVPATKILFASTSCRVRYPQPPLSSGGGPNCAERSQSRHGLYFLLSLLSSSYDLLRMMKPLFDFTFSSTWRSETPSVRPVL